MYTQPKISVCWWIFIFSEYVHENKSCFHYTQTISHQELLKMFIKIKKFNPITQDFLLISKHIIFFGFFFLLFIMLYLLTLYFTQVHATYIIKKFFWSFLFYFLYDDILISFLLLIFILFYFWCENLSTENQLLRRNFYLWFYLRHHVLCHDVIFDMNNFTMHIIDIYCYFFPF